MNKHLLVIINIYYNIITTFQIGIYIILVYSPVGEY